MIYDFPINGTYYKVFLPVFTNLDYVKQSNFLSTIWKLATIAELLNILIFIPLQIPIFRLLYKTAIFHRNFVNIILFCQFFFFTSNLGRIYLMGFEAEAILDRDLFIITYPLVTLASFLRLMEIAIGGMLLPLICLDRIFATYFVADYERNRKTKTFLAILFFCGIQGAFIVLSGMFLIITYPTECTIISVIIVSSVEISTFALYFKIVSLNRRALEWLESIKSGGEELSPPLGLTHYNLSVRYQVRENVRVLKILKWLVIGTFFAALFGVTLGYFALNSDKTTSSFAQFVGISYNLFLTLTGNGSSLVVVIIVKEWRDSVFRVWFKIIGYRRRSIFPVIEDISLKPQLETQAYFNYYANEW